MPLKGTKLRGSSPRVRTKHHKRKRFSHIAVAGVSTSVKPKKVKAVSLVHFSDQNVTNTSSVNLSPFKSLFTTLSAKKLKHKIRTVPLSPTPALTPTSHEIVQQRTPVSSKLVVLQPFDHADFENFIQTHPVSQQHREKHHKTQKLHKSELSSDVATIHSFFDVFSSWFSGKKQHSSSITQTHSIHTSTRRHLSTTITNSRESSSTPSETPSAPQLGQLYKVGDIVEDFRVDSAEVYGSISLAVYTFTHQRSKAQFVHIERDDADNAFCVGFRTMPKDDTGVAHILEHTVLCGSKKYPVRDPFFLLIRKSFATFMNAMTRPEATYYPFSTQNEQDFHNLLDVYLDAAFFPLLRKPDFAQEGHRIEPILESPNNSEEQAMKKTDDRTDANPALTIKNGSETSTLVPEKFEFKGVVFNEMKGDLSDPRSWLYQRVGRHLHTTSIYRNNSGGDPLSIPKLTYEQLLDFHTTHYHPGNAIFMTYGNRPAVLDKVNACINEKLDELKEKFPEKAQNSGYGHDGGDFPPQINAEIAVDCVKNKERFEKPRALIETGPVASMEDETRPYKVSMTWLCRDDHITDITSPYLMNIDALDIDSVETTVNFQGIDQEEGFTDAFKAVHGDDVDLYDVVDKLEITPKLKHNSPLVNIAAKQGKSAWAKVQLDQEVTNAERALKNRLLDLGVEENQLDTAIHDQKYADLYQEYVPNPKKIHTHENTELAGLLLKLKKLPKHELDSINQQFENTSLTILSSLLFDSTYSPLYTLLSDPSLGTTPSPTTGIDTWEHTPSVSLGFNGVKKQQLNHVLMKLYQALQDIAETGEGINPSTVNAILYQTELSLKDDRKRFGVNMLQKLISPFAYNQDIQHGFQIIDLLPLYKHIIETNGSLYFRTLIKHHLLSNNHRLCYVQIPNSQHNNDLKDAEEALLSQTTSKWGDEEKLNNLREAEELKAYQEEPVDETCLPSVKVTDIALTAKHFRYTTEIFGGDVHIPLKSNENDITFVNKSAFSAKNVQESQNDLDSMIPELGQKHDDTIALHQQQQTMLADINTIKENPTTGSTVLIPPNFSKDLQTNILSRPISYNVQPTNGIIIIRALVNDLGARLTPRQLSLIPYLNLLYGRIGAGGKDYKLHSHEIDQTAQDFSVQFSWDDLRVESVSNPGQYEYQQTFQASVKGKCLARNVTKMCQLLSESLTSADFTEHVYNTLAQYAGGLSSALEEGSAKYASLDAQSRISNYKSGVLHNNVYGIPHIQRTTALFKQISDDMNIINGDIAKDDAEGADESDQATERSASNQADSIGSESGDHDESASDAPKTKKVSPRMMKLANEIADTMRCVLAGPDTQHFTPKRAVGDIAPVRFNQKKFPQVGDDGAEVLDGEEIFQEIVDIEQLNCEKYKNQPVFPNVEEIQQPNTNVYPPTYTFGLDRVLITCDENTLANEHHYANIVSGVGNLINSAYYVQPVTFHPDAHKVKLTVPPEEDTDDQGPPVKKSTANITKQEQVDENTPHTANEWLEKEAKNTYTQRRHNFIAAPVQVNSVVFAQRSINHRHPDFGVMQVLSELVNERFLHTEIREKGGAYGRFASQGRDGIFSMGSIRDPQCTRTVEAFKKAIDWLRDVNNYTQQNLDEAKIGLFSGIDSPESAGNRGLIQWLRNADFEERQHMRSVMLNCTLEDIARCANEYLNFDEGFISVVGNKEKIPQDILAQQNGDQSGNNHAWNITHIQLATVPVDEDQEDGEQGEESDE